MPTIVVTGGPMLNGRWRGTRDRPCSDCGTTTRSCEPVASRRGGVVEIENCMSRPNGHCMTMGTASTMACVTEALGLTLPGNAAIPAADSRRRHLARRRGRRIVEMVERDLKPSTSSRERRSRTRSASDTAIGGRPTRSCT